MIKRGREKGEGDERTMNFKNKNKSQKRYKKVRKLPLSHDS
jgi:hypothetical protein